MLIIAGLYLGLVYVLFFKLKILPWNKISQGLVVLVGVVILTGFLVGLQGLTPASVQAAITGRVVDIAPEVSGTVIEVSARQNALMQRGDVLFKIDPAIYEAEVDNKQAALALAELRESQFTELAYADAASKFQMQQYQAEVEQLAAQLVIAKTNLKNTIVRAPSDGVVPLLFLQPGTYASPSKSILTFVDIHDLVVVAQIQQKALPNIKIGDVAMVNFPALPGQVFESVVRQVPTAIGDNQVMISGELPKITDANTTRLYPVYVTLPEDFPVELNKVGLAASVTIHTEGAGVVGIVAVILQWIGTSMDAII
jgi:RND family efflux transporter MFP subunit